MATIADRLNFFDGLHNYETALMRRKAADYSGTGDCNRNIMACEAMGICKAETGIMIRLFDKFQRLSTLMTAEAQVKEESLLDTIHDARNYLGILAHVLNDKRGTEGAPPNE